MTTHSTPKAFWLCAAVTTVSAIVSTGYSVAAITGPTTDRTLAEYTTSRSVALLLVVLGVLWFRSRPGLIALASCMILVQTFDAFIGLLLHIPFETFGPLLTAAFNLAALLFLMRSNTTQTAPQRDPR